MNEFVYVKPVSGHLVPRYSTLRSSSTTYIGARRDGKAIEWDTDAVVAIPLAEWNRYGREYRRALSEGSLMPADKAAYETWLKKREEESEASAKKLAEEVAKEKAAAEPAPATSTEEPLPVVPATDAKPAADAKPQSKKSKKSEGEKE